MDGLKIRPDPVVRHEQNDARRHFCTKHDGYEDFCDGMSFCSLFVYNNAHFAADHIDEQLRPVALPSISERINDPIFNVPLLIVAGIRHHFFFCDRFLFIGLSMNPLRLCLETVLRQPGINQSMVTVSYDEQYREAAELIQLFGFRTMALNSSSSYSGMMFISASQMFIK